MHSVEEDKLDPESRKGITFHSSLVTRCKIYLLLGAEVTRYSLQKLLVAKNHPIAVAKFARYLLHKLLVAKNCSLLDAKFACYSLQKLLVSKNYSSLVMKKTRELMFI